MEDLKKLRFIFFIPVWGVVINIIYIYSKNANNPSFSKKQLTKCMLAIGLTFFFGFVFIALLMRIINSFINIEALMEVYGLYIALIFAGYIINIPCLRYIKKFIES